MDNPQYELLNFINAAEEELFQDQIAETMSCMLSDGQTVDLVPNGRYIPVDFNKKESYVQKVKEIRLNESQAQSKAIRKGISQLVPTSILNILTWKELEEQVCGVPEVDIELLRRHTRYSKDLNSESPIIQWLWEVLSNFNNQDKAKFIKFCLGQERLPSNDEEFERNNIRFMIKQALNVHHGDRSLPQADTCFFNLELPIYSSKEILGKQLLFAITMDNESMNRDDPPSEQQEGVPPQDYYSQEEEEDYDEEDY